MLYCTITTMNKLPKFIGRPLVETPDIPMIGYLEGEFGKEFLEAYNSIVDKKYKGNNALKVLEFSDNIVKGSSTFSSILTADILRQNGLSLARPVDVEYARKLHESNPGIGLDTSGQYVDYGIVFRNVSEPNEYLAKKLEPEIKKALGVKKIKNPVPIFSGDLDLLNNEKASNGLGLSLKKGAKPFEAPVLKKNTSFSQTDENGMPIPDANGSRTSYTINSGLSGLSLDGPLLLCLPSSSHDLAYSASAGRVVVVKK